MVVVPAFHLLYKLVYHGQSSRTQSVVFLRPYHHMSLASKLQDIWQQISRDHLREKDATYPN